MRDTIAGWTAATNQLAIREQVIDALRLAIADQTAHIRTELDAIKDEAAAERSRLKRQARRGKLQGLALGLILGVAFAAAR